MAEKDSKREALKVTFKALKNRMSSNISREMLITILETNKGLFAEASALELTGLIDELLLDAEVKVKNYELKRAEERIKEDRDQAAAQQRLEESLEKAKLEALRLESDKLQAQHTIFKQDTIGFIAVKRQKRQQLVDELQEMKNSGQLNHIRLNVIGTELRDIDKNLEEQEELGKQHKNNIDKHYHQLASYHQELTADTSVKKQDSKTKEAESTARRKQKEIRKQEVSTKIETSNTYSKEAEDIIREIGEERKRVQEAATLFWEVAQGFKQINGNKSQKQFDFVTLLENPEQAIKVNKEAGNASPSLGKPAEQLKSPSRKDATPSYIADTMRNTLDLGKDSIKPGQLPRSDRVASNTPNNKTKSYPEERRR